MEIKKEEKIADKLNLVAYCGLYCGLCAEHTRIPRQASNLRESMVKEGYESLDKNDPRLNKEFWEFLTNLSNPDL